MNNQTFGVICIVAGMAVGGYFSRAMWRMIGTHRWKIGRAKILESYVIDNASSVEPYVKYSYTANGVSYESETIAPNNYVISSPSTAASLRSMERMIAAYPVGAQVKMYFDPSNPQNSVLTTSEPIFGNLVVLFVSLMFLTAGWSLMSAKPL
jgi:hypothetical protein